MFKKIFFSACITLFGIISNGQELYFKTLTVNDGLTQHDVSCVLKDSYGFTWIGTYDGLNRYDGFNVLNFARKTNDNESLSSNRILCLFEDSKKRIWIGTDGGGLDYYSLVTEKFVRVETPKNFDKITDIAENSKGEIFIATTGGILKTSNADGASVDILQLPVTGLRITDITILNGDDVFFSTNQGIWTLKNNTCEQIPGTENVYSSKIITDQKGQIWSILNGKLTILKKNQQSYTIEEVKSFPKTIVLSLCEAKDGTIWIGTDNFGLFSLHPTDHSVIQNIKHNASDNRGLLSNSILSLYCDKDNILWIGNRQGLCYTNLSQKGFQHISFEGLPNVSRRPHIRTLFIDDENLYYGIQNRGLFRYSFSTKKTEELIKEEYTFPLCINKIDGIIYVGTNKGVYTNSNSSINFTPINIVPKPDNLLPTQVLSICGDNTNGRYFGTFSGLIVTKGNTTDWIHNLFPQAEILRGKRIFSLLYDKDENCIWIGTLSNGLYKLNLTRDGNFLSLEQYSQSMKTNYHIADNNIWCFYKDKDGTLWIGTDAGLLRKPKNSNQISQLNIEEIVDKKIMGIVGDDDGNLWLTNSKGLIRFNIAKNIVRRYSYNDGLQSSTFTEAVGKGKDGTLYFGSIHGIDFFNPQQIAVNSFKPAIAISDFKIHNISISPTKSYFGKQVLEKSINLTNELSLNYKQNNFLFEFTGTNYDNTNENHFRYKLDGYDSGWIYKTGAHRFANYSNLNPGTYTFWADAANSDGVWSDSPKKILITILPAPWFSWWAYLAYFVIGAGIIFGFIVLRSNRQKLKHEIDLKNMQYDKEKEINELKLMFFTDVAHEFKTPLSLIVGPLNDLTNNNITDEHRNFCFTIISRNTKRMMFLVSQLLDFSKLNANKNILKISNSDLSEFTTQITKAFQWQAKDEEINFNVIAPETFECFFDRDLIEKVVYNLLSNAFKYTPANGIVEIEVKPIWNNEKQIANIIVRDSGKGIPDEQKGKIFERYFHGNQRSSSGIGLHLSYSLINAHKGKLTVADSSYGGTEFIVTISVSKNDYQDFEFSKVYEDKPGAEDFLLESEASKKEFSEEHERILIVEDDHDLRAYLKNCLKSNYLVIEAQNGSDGLKKATEKSPDIIITDVMMPEMNGIEMCKILKANPETSHIPILVLTAKTAQEQEKEGLDAGAFDYIAKPFNTQSLLKKIDNIIESRKSFRNAISNLNLNFDLKKHYTPFDQKLLSNAIKIIEENISDEYFSVEDFAKQVGFSRMQLHRKLKALTGCSATEFINTIKINYATKMFDEGCDRVNEAMDAVGITSYSHFNKLFKKVNGTTASEYLKIKT
ncbi:hybrid sensor histidine kinase/response regulator transcription factor [Lacibacter sp. H407]|uniref:hybrid sensor histidine kinase/response regulator transcription factor n=1 Tax=Lacibacter sp. H407 TaxID=3133423 RepID=UPI0030C3027E